MDGIYRIRELREAAGFSRSALARAAGLHVRTVRRLEQGSHSPTGDSLVALARALRVDVPDLFASTACGDGTPSRGASGEFNDEPRHPTLASVVGVAGPTPGG